MALESIQAITEFFARVENRETFFERVHKFTPPHHREPKLIVDAYRESKDAFRGVRRKRGERYFEHCRAVAVTLMDIVLVRDLHVIAAALLHDIVEDCEAQWSIEHIHQVFGRTVAVLVAALTMPKGEFASREMRLAIYHTQLLAAPLSALKIKLADRFHNMYTSDGLALENQLRMMEETERVYIPLAKEHGVLYHELTTVLAHRKQMLNV